MNFICQRLKAFGQRLNCPCEFSVLLEHFKKKCRLLGCECLTLVAGVSEILAVLGISLGMGLVAIRLAGLCQKDQGGSIGRL